MITKETLDQLVEMQTKNGSSINQVALHVSKEAFKYCVVAGFFKVTESKKKKLRSCDATYNGVRVYISGGRS